jgi:hypothetical protein
MILVASRHHPEPSMKQVHEKTWKVVREALADYSFSGLPASVGFVEGVLLLAEFLPRERSGKPLSADLLGSETKSTMEGMENRRSWALTGLAIRAAYGIGCTFHVYRCGHDELIFSGSDISRDHWREERRYRTGKKRLDLVLLVRPHDR